MNEVLKALKKVYELYFKCSNCDSTYHVSTFKNLQQFECKDCKGISSVPAEVREKAAKEK